MRASPWPPSLIALVLTVCLLNMATSTGPCPYCSFVFTNVRDWMSHLRGAHSSEPNFNVTCGVSGCAHTATTFSALYSHVYRWHSEVIRSRSRPDSEVDQARNWRFLWKPMMEMKVRGCCHSLTAICESMLWFVFMVLLAISLHARMH